MSKNQVFRINKGACLTQAINSSKVEGVPVVTTRIWIHGKEGSMWSAWLTRAELRATGEWLLAEAARTDCRILGDPDQAGGKA